MTDTPYGNISSFSSTKFDPAEFDPALLAEKAIQSNLDPTCFDQIKDSGIRQPQNVFEWMRGRRFLNISPFPKQVEIAVNFYSQFCPRCTDPSLVEAERWGNKLLTIPTDYPISEIVDRIVFMEDGVCPQCKVNQLELFAAKELNYYTNLNGCAGMRSSKTVIVGGIIGTYQLCRFLMLKNPAHYFGLLDNQTLHGTFVAITAGQAQETLWDAFKDRVDAAPWFKDYHIFLEEEAKRLGKERFHNDKQTFLAYEHKQLVVSFCGPDIRTIRGRTRFMTGIDEKGWFDVQADSTSSSNTKIRLNAHQTHEALIKSLRTIRSASMRLRENGIINPPDGTNCDVSSPSSLNDAIMVGLREANDDPTMYPFHYATWEMNPFVPLNSLRSEMRNRRDFERDYAAVPPLGANQFIDNQNSVEKAQDKFPQNKWITWTKRYITDEFGDKTMYLEVKVVKRDRNRPRILTIDTGLANNSYAITMWSYDRENQRPQCDIAIECMPEIQNDDRILVNFPMMFEHAVVPLVTDFRVIMAAFDRWNSIDSVQRLRKDYKVEAIQYVLKWADYLMVRSRIIDSNFRIPKMEMSIDDVRKSDRSFDDIVRSVPVTHLALQILTVRQGGRKVIKPINGTDDLFRCLCLALKFILDPEYTKKFEQYGVTAGFDRPVIGVYRSNRDQSITVAMHTRGDTNIGIRKSFVPTLK